MRCALARSCLGEFEKNRADARQRYSIAYLNSVPCWHLKSPIKLPITSVESSAFTLSETELDRQHRYAYTTSKLGSRAPRRAL